jgi:hypothetical protein
VYKTNLLLTNYSFCLLYIVWWLYMFSVPHLTVIHVFFLSFSLRLFDERKKMHFHKLELKKLSLWFTAFINNSLKYTRKFNHRFDICILLVELLPGALFWMKVSSFQPSFMQCFIVRLVVKLVAIFTKR